MKRRLARGCALLLLLCLLLCAAPALAQAGGVTAMQEHCYIRSAPGLSGEILCTVPVGETATYMYETSVDNRGVIWYMVYYGDIVGWMSDLQVFVDFAVDTDGDDVVTAVEEHCYIRSAPGLNGEILYTVPVGAPAAYLYETSVDGRGVIWYKATYAGVTGWMSGLQVSVNFDDGGGRSHGTNTITAAQEHCYIRTAPGLDGEILDTVPVGEAADFLNETSVDGRGVTWYRARYNGIVGWMSGLQIMLD